MHKPRGFVRNFLLLAVHIPWNLEARSYCDPVRRLVRVTYGVKVGFI